MQSRSSCIGPKRVQITYKDDINTNEDKSKTLTSFTTRTIAYYTFIDEKLLLSLYLIGYSFFCSLKNKNTNYEHHSSVSESINRFQYKIELKKDKYTKKMNKTSHCDVDQTIEAPILILTKSQ